MKKRFLLFLIIALSAVLSVTAFAACTGNGDNNGNGSELVAYSYDFSVSDKNYSLVLTEDEIGGSFTLELKSGDEQLKLYEISETSKNGNTVKMKIYDAVSDTLRETEFSVADKKLTVNYGADIAGLLFGYDYFIGEYSNSASDAKDSDKLVLKDNELAELNFEGKTYTDVKYYPWEGNGILLKITGTEMENTLAYFKIDKKAGTFGLSGYATSSTGAPEYNYTREVISVISSHEIFQNCTMWDNGDGSGLLAVELNDMVSEGLFRVYLFSDVEKQGENYQIKFYNGDQNESETYKLIKDADTANYDMEKIVRKSADGNLELTVYVDGYAVYTKDNVLYAGYEIKDLDDGYLTIRQSGGYYIVIDSETVEQKFYIYDAYAYEGLKNAVIYTNGQGDEIKYLILDVNKGYGYFEIDNGALKRYYCNVTESGDGSSTVTFTDENNAFYSFTVNPDGTFNW